MFSKWFFVILRYFEVKNSLKTSPKSEIISRFSKSNVFIFLTLEYVWKTFSLQMYRNVENFQKKKNFPMYRKFSFLIFLKKKISQGNTSFWGVVTPPPNLVRKSIFFFDLKMFLIFLKNVQYILGKLLKIVIFFSFCQSFTNRCEKNSVNLLYILVKHVFFTHEFFLKWFYRYVGFLFLMDFPKKKENFSKKNVFFSSHIHWKNTWKSSFFFHFSWFFHSFSNMYNISKKSWITLGLWTWVVLTRFYQYVRIFFGMIFHTKKNIFLKEKDMFFSPHVYWENSKKSSYGYDFL